MPDEIRIGVEPPPIPPPRSGKVLALTAGLILLAGAGAWLAGVFGEDPPTTTRATATSTTTATGAPTTAALDDRLAAARLFWTALGRGDVAAATATVAAPTAAAIDLMGFVAAFRAGFAVGECTGFAFDAVQCTVTVTEGSLMSLGIGTPDEALRVADDGRFDVSAVVASSAARLSLYALEAHTEELRTACPVTDNPRVPRLAIVGSATASCGGYLAGLIPEYLAAALHLTGGPRE